MSNIEIKTIITGPLEENTYVISKEGFSLLIDPGSDNPIDITHIKKAIGKNKLLAIICTHNHFDHIGGVHCFDVPSYMHKEDIATLDFQKTMSSFVIGVEVILPKDIQELSEHMSVGPFQFQVIHTPGHSKGSSCLLFDKDMFSGDTVFKGTSGRTDLPYSNPSEMKNSLSIILSLNPKIKIYPGHGPFTTVAKVSLWASRP